MRLFTLLLLFIFTISLKAQEYDRKFHPVVFLGVVASQVDGDLYGSYSKAGLNGGFGITRAIHPKWNFDLGISYIQKGSRKNINPKDNDYTFYILRLNYVEVPLLFKYHIKTFNVVFGMNAGYLISSHEESHVGMITYPFKKTDFCASLGFEFKITEKLSVMAKTNYSIRPVRDYLTQGAYPPSIFFKGVKPGLYNNYITITLHYTFIPKKNEISEGL